MRAGAAQRHSRCRIGLTVHASKCEEKRHLQPCLARSDVSASETCVQKQYSAEDAHRRQSHGRPPAGRRGSGSRPPRGASASACRAAPARRGGPPVKPEGETSSRPGTDAGRRRERQAKGRRQRRCEKSARASESLYLFRLLLLNSTLDPGWAGLGWLWWSVNVTRSSSSAQFDAPRATAMASASCHTFCGTASAAGQARRHVCVQHASHDGRANL